MNIFIFSIVNNFIGFHRKPEICELAKNLSKTGGKVYYFSKPTFFLSKQLLTKEKQTYQNIILLRIFTLLPLRFAIKNRYLLKLFITYPIQLQLYLIKRLFKLTNQELYYWIYKPDQYNYLINNKIKYIYLHYDNYEEDTNYYFSAFKTFHITLKNCINDSYITLCTSSKLTKKLKAISNKKQVFYYPNAISRELLTEFVPNTVNANLNNITVGFIGQLDNSFDYSLLEKLLSHFKHFTFIVVGKIQNDEIKLLQKKFLNLRLPGFVPYEELPSVISSFDVGICPYNDSAFNKYRNPLKVYEYFTYGLPVVCSNCDVDSKVEQLISISKNHEEFIENLLKELSSNNIKKTKERITFAENNCWDNRVYFVMDKLNET